VRLSAGAAADDAKARAGRDGVDRRRRTDLAEHELTPIVCGSQWWSTEHNADREIDAFFVEEAFFDAETYLCGALVRRHSKFKTHRESLRNVYAMATDRAGAVAVAATNRCLACVSGSRHWRRPIQARGKAG
jgi:hypothetical protein